VFYAQFVQVHIHVNPKRQEGIETSIHEERISTQLSTSLLPKLDSKLMQSGKVTMLYMGTHTDRIIIETGTHTDRIK
jgi:hypothetical protein